jgi:hypothetical protein
MPQTRTYYFETCQTEDVLVQILEKLDLKYYKIMHYNLGLRNKTISIVQFEKRVSKKYVLQTFATGKTGMHVILRVNQPMILPHVRIYLLGKHHDVTSAQVHEWGKFSFGGRNTTIATSIRPYLHMLENYKKHKNDKHFNFLKGGQKLCEFQDALERLPVHKI